MRIWKIAAVAVLALSSFAADNVAPTKSELEEMYNKAFREFDANNFPQALKELDAIDARQPDLAASQNLRGVILMRQGIYDKAEVALLEAERIDPKFWNARFNLAEIPFLKKDWVEARKRFEKLLSSSQSDLASEASQLIQYKILLTYLLEGKENMVDSILAKLELSSDTPAVDYVKAAVALQHKNEKEAKDWIAVAEKNFSPQLNKLFAESLFEAGWLEKPAGQGRASLPLMTAAERSEKTKAVARSKFEQAQQALRQRDFATAGKLISEADQSQPNQAATLNLRGEILMEQKSFDEAEAAFRKAARLDPKFREAQYNLAQVPFKKKDYAKARERFEALLEQTPGGDKNQAAQLIKFKIYLALLLEGKESRAQAIMEQFQFTGDTPALYYAQAAWEIKHNNPEKGADWTASAKKIYSPALNSVFADAFYDLGWMQSPEIAAAPGPAIDAGSVIASQTEGSPAIEPSPIPDTVVAANKQASESKAESLAPLSAAVSPASAGMETPTSGTTALAQNKSGAPGTTAGPGQAPATSVATSSPSVESPAAAAPSVAIAPSASVGQNEGAAPGKTETSSAVTGATAVNAAPAKQTAPSRVLEWLGSGIGAMASRQTLLIGGLLLAGIFLLAWVIVPQLRRTKFNISRYLRVGALGRSRAFEPTIASAASEIGLGNQLFGGPREVSLQLSASKPSLRRSAFPPAKSVGTLARTVDLDAEASQASAQSTMEPDHIVSSLAEPIFESVGPVVEQAAEVSERELASMPDPVELSAVTDVAAPVPPEEELPDVSVLAEKTAESAIEPTVETEPEPIVHGQPIAPEIPVSEIGSAAAEPVDESAPHFPDVISTESILPQITTPPTMPETNQIPSAPATKTPASAVTKSQPAGTTQTSVQLTFSFEIAAMQLTPTFKMGVLQVRPASKIVSMRLAPSEQPQSAMNFQVNFEITRIQPAGGAFGNIRLTPSQQKPAMGSPSFTVAGLKLVPNFEATPVQLTPSQQGQTSVLVTVPFQITTIDFLPSLEIASVVLDSNSKQVFVQLPGAAGAGPSEEAPMFEIANLQMSEGGEIGMMQLNLLGHGPRQT